MSGSISGDFWSKLGEKRGVIAPSPAPTSTPAPAKPEEPTRAEASTTKKPGLVFKSNRSSSISDSAHSSAPPASSSVASAQTKLLTTSWADSVEEDLEAARGLKSPTALATTIEKDFAEYVDEAQAKITEQMGRIEQLEADCQTKAEIVKNLEDTVHSLEKRLDEMDNAKRDQDIHIAELAEELNNKKRDNQELQKDLVSTFATLRELELQVAENVRAPSSDASTEIGDVIDDRMRDATVEQAPTSTTPGVSQISDDSKDLYEIGDYVPPTKENVGPQATDLTENIKTPVKADTTPPAQHGYPALSTEDFPALGSLSPASVPLQPKFATMDTIKQVPPPPPAKKLTFGIDPSKFQKKKPQPIAGRKMMYNSRHGDAERPEIDPGKDIRRMSKAERELFGYGPTAQITIDNKVVATVPKYVFMQVSPKAFRYWKDTPNAVSMKFKSGDFTLNALSVQLEWIAMHTYCNKVFSVSLRQDVNDRHNLELVRCARALGLHPMYMGHFTRMFCETIREGPSPELVSLVEELAWDNTEPIFECLANNWASMCAKATPEDAAAWEDKLARLPRLSAKVCDTRIRRSFALGGVQKYGQAKTKENEYAGWKSMPPTKAAGETPALTVTAPANNDPDADWRASGPAYM